MGILACCFYTCRSLCPNGPPSVFRALEVDDDVTWRSVRDIEVEVDERSGLLGVRSAVAVVEIVFFLDLYLL